MGSAPCHSRQPIYLGGPVPRTVDGAAHQAFVGRGRTGPGRFFRREATRTSTKLVLTEEPVVQNPSSDMPAGAPDNWKAK